MFKVRIHKNEKPLFAKQISFYCESLFNLIFKDELLLIQKIKISLSIKVLQLIIKTL